MEKKSENKIGSRSERRKKLGDAICWDQYYKSQGKCRPAWPTGTSAPKVMSNKDRRKMGIEQDPAIPDFDKNYKET